MGTIEGVASSQLLFGFFSSFRGVCKMGVFFMFGFV